MTVDTGTTLGPYRVLGQLGRGGMATVYKAHHAELSRYVAIKVLPGSLAHEEGFQERFLQEARSIANLRHPNILAVFDFGRDDDLCYIVNEFVDGGTLADQMGGPLPLEYVVQMLEPIASALDYAHSRGIMHRDVKPTNILLARDGHPVLGDFGLARMMESDAKLTATGMIVGTPQYMAPEQCRGEEASGASDQYSLGLIAYEMLTGQPPFTAATPAAVVLAQINNKLPPPRLVNPALSEEVEGALLKVLAKTPGDRFRTCAEFLRALRGASVPQASARPAVAAGQAVPLPLGRASRRPRIPYLSVAAGVVALALVGAGTGIAWSRGVIGPRPPAPTVSTLAAARGPLLYQARFDGTDAGQPVIRGSVQMSHGAGGLQISIPASGAGDVGGTLGGANPVAVGTRYVAEVDLAEPPGSAIEFQWHFVQTNTDVFQADVHEGTVQLEHMAQVAPATGGATSTGGTSSTGTAYCPPTCPGPPAPGTLTAQGNPQPTPWPGTGGAGASGPTPTPGPSANAPAIDPLSHVFPVPGLATGQICTLGAIVDGSHLRFFVSGHQVADLHLNGLSGSTAATVGFVASGGPGSVTISGARIYQLR